jgi:hypothetical protein
MRSRTAASAMGVVCVFVTGCVWGAHPKSQVRQIAADRPPEAQAPAEPDDPAPPEEDPDLAPEEAIRRALKTPVPHGPERAARAYDRLFAGCSEAKLRELGRSTNPSIALQARWELRNSPHPLPSDLVHPDYIPGFLEGDFGLRAPMRWAVDFAMWWCMDRSGGDGLAEFYHKARFPGIGKKEKFTFTEGKTTKVIEFHTINVLPDQHRTSFGPLAPRNIQITATGDTVSLRIDNHELRLASRLFTLKSRIGLASPPDQLIVDAAIVDDKAFLVVGEPYCTPSWLHCLKFPSGHVVWRSVVWAGYADWCPAGSGPRENETQLVCDGQKISVFGRGRDFGYFIESFDARSGENLLRFSSGYSDWDGFKQFHVGGPRHVLRSSRHGN